jgi:hypothetical protein
MKHVGKMKNNGAPVVIVFRTIPGDPNNCLVVGTQGMGPTQHDSLMQVIETPEAQASFELGTILSVRRFPDNYIILQWMHQNGKLKKVPTTDVIVTFSPQETVQLDELNRLIAEQRGITINELASVSSTKGETMDEIASVKELPAIVAEPAAKAKDPGILDDTTLAKQFRSQADALFKEAQSLRKQADELDPPATKKIVKQIEEVVVPATKKATKKAQVA